MSWFNAREVDPAQSGAQFPIGRHPVIAKGSTRMGVKGKEQTDGMLGLSLEIIDGPHKGVSGIYRLNLWNSSEQARDIAAKQLSAICHVTNTPDLADQNNMGVEFFGKPFMIIVSQQPQNPQYTQIDGVTDMAGNFAAKGAFAGPAGPSYPQQPAQPQQPAFTPSAGPGGYVQQPTGAPVYAPQPQQPPAGQPYNPGQPTQPQFTPGQPQQPQQPQYAPQPNPAPQQPAQPSWQQQPAGGGGVPSWQR